MVSFARIVVIINKTRYIWILLPLHNLFVIQTSCNKDFQAVRLTCLITHYFFIIAIVTVVWADDWIIYLPAHLSIRIFMIEIFNELFGLTISIIPISIVPFGGLQILAVKVSPFPFWWPSLKANEEYYYFRFKDIAKFYSPSVNLSIFHLAYTTTRTNQPRRLFNEEENDLRKCLGLALQMISTTRGLTQSSTKEIGKPNQHLKLVKQSPKSLLNRIYLLLSFCTKSATTWWTDLISCVCEIRSKSANGLSPSQSSAGDKLHWPALRIVTHTHSMRHLWQFKQQILIYHTKVNYLQRVNQTHPHKPANECHKL